MPHAPASQNSVSDTGRTLKGLELKHKSTGHIPSHLPCRVIDDHLMIILKAKSLLGPAKV